MVSSASLPFTQHSFVPSGRQGQCRPLGCGWRSKPQAMLLPVSPSAGLFLTLPSLASFTAHFCHTSPPHPGSPETCWPPGTPPPPLPPHQRRCPPFQLPSSAQAGLKASAVAWAAVGTSCLVLLCSILLCCFHHLSIHPFLSPAINMFSFLMHFKINCRHQYMSLQRAHT